MEGLNTGGINSHLNMNTKEDLSHYNSNLIRNDDKVPMPDSKLLLIGSDNQVPSKVKNTLYNKNDYISSSEICDSEDDNSRSSPLSCKKRRRLSDSSGSENSPAKPHKEEKRDYFEEVKEEESSSGSESSKVSCNYHDSSDAEQRVVMSAPAPSHPLSDSDEDLIVAVADTPSRKKGAVHTIKTIPKPRKPRNIKVKKSPPKSKSKYKRPVTDSSDSEEDIYYSSRRGRRKSRDEDRKRRDPLAYYKKLIRAMEVKIPNYTKFFEGCTSLNDKKNKLLEIMQEKGLKGKPTLAACKKIGKKNKLKNEVAELDRENIICDSGRPRRRNVYSRYLSASTSEMEPHGSRVMMAQDSNSSDDEISNYISKRKSSTDTVDVSEYPKVFLNREDLGLVKRKWMADNQEEEDGPLAKKIKADSPNNAEENMEAEKNSEGGTSLATVDAADENRSQAEKVKNNDLDSSLANESDDLHKKERSDDDEKDKSDGEKRVNQCGQSDSDDEPINLVRKTKPRALNHLDSDESDEEARNDDDKGGFSESDHEKDQKADHEEDLKAEEDANQTDRNGGDGECNGGVHAAENSAPMDSDGGKSAQMDSEGGKNAQMDSDGGKSAQMDSEGGKNAEMDSDGGKNAHMDIDGGKNAHMDSDGGKNGRLDNGTNGQVDGDEESNVTKFFNSAKVNGEATSEAI